MTDAAYIARLRLLVLAAAVLFWAMPQTARAETGIASIYGTEHGQTRTASGERFTGQSMTCAHRTAP